MWDQLSRLLRWPNFYAALALLFALRAVYALYQGDGAVVLASLAALVLTGIVFVFMCRPFTRKTPANRSAENEDDCDEA
jgi:hypothetical protein